MSMQSWWEETSRLEAASNDCHERRKIHPPPPKKKKRGQAVLVSQVHIHVLQGPNFSKQERPRLQRNWEIIFIIIKIEWSDPTKKKKRNLSISGGFFFSFCHVCLLGKWKESLLRSENGSKAHINFRPGPVRTNGSSFPRHGWGALNDYSPSRSSFTSLAAFSPSSLRFLSIILDLSAAALSSWLTVQPIVPSARFRSAA